SYWQMLPLHPVGDGNSPYQSPSAFAGNRHFLDPGVLCAEGVIDRGAERAAQVPFDRKIAYTDIERRAAIVHQAIKQTHLSHDRDYAAFCEEHAFWLDEYALYEVAKAHSHGWAWYDWREEALRNHDPAAIRELIEGAWEEIEEYRKEQYFFFRQWRRLREYAHRRGIALIGDLPIYVAYDSADVWANRESFDLDAAGYPNHVAGVPPDAFSATGQRWGNPLYNWWHMERDNFAWWNRRICLARQLYDVVRIDHFIGIAQYYAIPGHAEDALTGKWLPGPSSALLTSFQENGQTLPFIAEDLGRVTPAVRELMQAFGYPGMRVLAFAFDSGPANEHLPCHYHPNTVVYGATHDNDTLYGTFESASKSRRDFARAYLATENDHPATLTAAAIRAAMASVADVAVFTMQDYLRFDSQWRINRPGEKEGNWDIRIPAHCFSRELSEEMLRLARLYHRFGEETATFGIS
ncbi:MAG: 4-alpha-glucanotransferase, partial [Eubacteriales bacterium]